MKLSLSIFHGYKKQLWVSLRILSPLYFLQPRCLTIGGSWLVFSVSQELKRESLHIFHFLFSKIFRNSKSEKYGESQEKWRKKDWKTKERLSPTNKKECISVHDWDFSMGTERESFLSSHSILQAFPLELNFLRFVTIFTWTFDWLSFLFPWHSCVFTLSLSFSTFSLLFAVHVFCVREVR